MAINLALTKNLLLQARHNSASGVSLWGKRMAYMGDSTEIFNGSIPPLCLAQIMRCVDFSQWPGVYVACSGMFTFERAIAQAYPRTRCVSNDVSLLSGAMAGLATGEALSFTFKGRFADLEEELQGAPYHVRVGALMTALLMARNHRHDNRRSRQHFQYYVDHILEYAEKSGAAAQAAMVEANLLLYKPRDLRVHIDEAIETGQGVIVSAPFERRWYEKWFQFLHDNVDWQPPSYDIWDPDDFPSLMQKVADSGVPYCMVYSKLLPDQQVVAYHKKGYTPPFYVYSNTARTGSIIERIGRDIRRPFAFNAVDIDKIGPDTKIKVYRTKAGYADYVKALYLQENIPWSTAPVNFLIYLDDMLAGILCYRGWDKQTPGLKNTDQPHRRRVSLYLLSDTCTTRFGRVSKLISMLALSRSVLRTAERSILHRPCEYLYTSVRSNHPVSMKYRGVWKLLYRGVPGKYEQSNVKHVILYEGRPNDREPEEIYEYWFKRYFKDDRSRRVSSSYEQHKGPAEHTADQGQPGGAEAAR